MHPVFIAAVFTRARTWTQSKRPSTDDWIKMTWYIYAMEYYSAIKRDGLGHSQRRGWPYKQSEVSQKETGIVYYLIYVESGKMVEMIYSL